MITTMNKESPGGRNKHTTKKHNKHTNINKQSTHNLHTHTQTYTNIYNN